jgi:DNA replication and repair protein RecF
VHLTSLHLQDFRNYIDTRVGFSEGSNLVLGRNGQGKTNLLEAIFVLSTSKSFRHITDRKLTRRGAEGYCVTGEFSRDGGEALSVSLAYRDGGKTLTINGSRQERISTIVGQVYSVIISFEDIGLVTGPPAGRRALLDLVLSTTDSLYFETLKAYVHVVKQKNSFLSGTAVADEGLLEVWNDQIVRNGSYLLFRRLELIECFNRYIREHGDAMKQFLQPLTIGYRSTAGDLSGTLSEDELRERFDEALVSSMDRELRMGQSVCGPHRDDFTFSDNRSEIRSFGSLGEARFASIVLKLAQADYYREKGEVHPILLVDDVLLELDSANRRRVLMLFGRDYQLIITTTEKGRLPETFSPERVFHLKEGGGITWQEGGSREPQ